MSIPSLQSLAINKITIETIWQCQLHLDTELPPSLHTKFKARFTFQALFDENLFDDDLDPELIYACLNEEQHHCLWYFLGHRNEYPCHPFEDPSTTPEQRKDALIALRTFLLFFIQHPGQLLEASTGHWYNKSCHHAWSWDDIGFYLYTSFGVGLDLDAKPYKQLDQIIAILLENVGNRVVWEVIPVATIPDREKKGLKALHAISEIDHDLFRRDLHRFHVDVEGRLQFAIHPLTNAECLTFRMIGQYLYVATENNIFYYSRDDGDLLLTILDYNHDLLRLSTATS